MMGAHFLSVKRMRHCLPHLAKLKLLDVFKIYQKQDNSSRVNTSISVKLFNAAQIIQHITQLNQLSTNH